jgi:hypothetical protein
MSQSPVIIQSHEYVVKTTKSEFVYDADITMALHNSGSWYLIPRKYCFQHMDNELDSLVFHVCPKSWMVKANPDERGVEHMEVMPYTVHRTTPSSMRTPCQYCGSPVPEDIIGLYTLHNWDLLAEKDHTA